MDGHQQPDLQTVAEGLGRAFPDLEDIRPCRLLGSGFHNLAIETAGGIVFRIGRDAGAAQRYAVEYRILPAICTLLPAPVPVPRWFADRTEAFPNGVLGYRKVPGKEMSRAKKGSSRLLRQLAAFLLALHAVPVELARSKGVLDASGRDGASGTWNRVERVLRTRLDEEQFGVVAGWWEDFLADDKVWVYPLALIHSDLWYENVLVDDVGDLAGVIDFDHPAIGDRAQDLATLRHLGAAFATEARAVYLRGLPIEDELIEYREERLWEYREFEGIDWAIEANDDVELEDGIRKLRAGPILST